ncbi:MAG: ferritin-like fold-containing protein, partial [Pseudolysinimonas sp.]
AEVLEVHEAVLAELHDRRIDPADAMEPFRAGLDDFQRRTQGDDWHEILISCYLTSGFLLDFFAGLAAGLPGGLSDRISALLSDDEAEGLLVEELRDAIDGNPRLASRLAMWGRRLVGDTMLVARSALVIGGQAPGDERVEPIFTELIAAHTRRMDALGLTA